ncbi:MAG: polysaccharide biosynthesis tyrosine autokinase [Acidimicrobiales bacterium]
MAAPHEKMLSLLSTSMSPTSRPTAPRARARERLGFVRRRMSLIVLVTVLATAGATGADYLRTPVYEASAQVQLTEPRPGVFFEDSSAPLTSDEREVTTQIRVVTSEPVRVKVREVLGEAPAVSAELFGKSNIIRIRARDSDPQDAADVANAYATSFKEVRKALAIDEILAAVEQTQERLRQLQREIDRAPPPERDALVQRRAALDTKVDELQIKAKAQTGDAEIVVPARAPRSKSEPQPARAGAMAFGAGLVLGMLLAASVDAFDDSIKNKGEFERLFPDLPVLGMIPVIGSWKAKDQALVVSLTEPRAPAAEAYRSLRTAVEYGEREPFLGTLQVTSASESEGKSTTAANLGVAFAAEGHRVVLVCCDLRRPRLHEFFGLTNDIGFTSVLLGKVPLSEALQEVPTQPRLFVLASGPLPPNPSELLASGRTFEVITSLQSDADIVIVDSPPVLPVTDALVMSSHVDATVLVAVVASTNRREVRRAVELLDHVDAALVGAVLNGIGREDSYGDSYVERVELRHDRG